MCYERIIQRPDFNVWDVIAELSATFRDILFKIKLDSHQISFPCDQLPRECLWISTLFHVKEYRSYLQSTILPDIVTNHNPAGLDHEGQQAKQPNVAIEYYNKDVPHSDPAPTKLLDGEDFTLAYRSDKLGCTFETTQMNEKHVVYVYL